MMRWGRTVGGVMAAAVLAVGTVWSAAGSMPQAHAAAGTGSPTFTDVKASHWAYSAVQQAVASGYVDGYINGTFKPEASVSRAEFVKMVVAAMKLDVADTPGKWYVRYADAATAKGLYEAGDFANTEAAWNKTMTREEMARVAARAVGETSKEDDKWMYLATKGGLIQGVGKGQLAPKGLTTRAQSVVIIDRILKTNAGGKLESDRYATGAAEILWHGTNIFTVMPEKFVTPESDWKNKGKSSIEEMWNEKNMTITSKDGLYQGKLDALIAIDLDDKNDPNRGLLPLDKLKWFNGYGNFNEGVDLYINKEKGNYLLYFKGKPVFNKDPKRYLTQNLLFFSVDAFDSPNETAMQNKNVLNGIAPVYQNDPSDTPMVIVPKTGTVQRSDNITIQLVTPASGSLEVRTNLLSLRGTK
ncbi:hypothetical protein B9G55_16495 [Saccharibacillus sp. O16]|nr:hypothetical protein B9G55_16495 [Saccharibacillus sp. O16]